MKNRRSKDATKIIFIQISKIQVIVKNRKLDLSRAERYTIKFNDESS